MERRQFISQRLTFSLTGASATHPWYSSQVSKNHKPEKESEVYVERAREDRPHTGKVLVAIQPHSDDIPLFAGGTVAKLIKEGYTGYLIRITNDDHAGRGDTIGDVYATMRQ